MAESVVVVESPDHFRDLLSKDLQRISLLNFWAPWAEPCATMNKQVAELVVAYPKLLTLQIDAEQQEDIAETFEVESVPTFIILRGHTLLGKLQGADPVALKEKIASFFDAPPASNPVPAPTEDLNTRLEKLVNQDKIMLFMKGTRDAPRCGFSRKIVDLLNKQDVKYSTFDILSDEDVRAGLKEFNKWPTFPQLIINGEFVGGLDVVAEMVENGEFEELAK